MLNQTKFLLLIGFFLSALCFQNIAKAGPRALIYEAWYKGFCDHTVPCMYYLDKIETAEGKYYFENHTWKLNDGFVDEDQLGSVSRQDASLEPIFYHYRSVHGTQEKLFEGNIGPGKIDKKLTVHIKKNGKEVAPISRGLSQRAIFSSQFPLLIKHNWDKITAGKSVSFLALMEDKDDTQFASISGKITPQKDDAFATKLKLKKILVQLGLAASSTWWVESSGKAHQIVFDKEKITFKLSDEASTRKFLSR